MAEADWSQLPKDLLNLISQRLVNELDLIRYRSVCSNLSSSSTPNHYANGSNDVRMSSDRGKLI
ncbi:hypothetical protein MTR_6g076200 [Medicago truncatula]|uniref:F-box domain-containing protein n=1 Tax=Medicago truncatula TaxID=3880 RepID=G7KJT5_MEDTR|nr:hypothetical protein MTR_6g076200 [Medicago truncatula]